MALKFTRCRKNDQHAATIDDPGLTWVLIPPLPIRASGSSSAMASQTKVEPVERSTVKGPSSSVGVARGDAEDTAADRSAPESSVEASPATASADDEDVSLDELMMSDSSDGDEAGPEDPATEPSGAPAPLSVQSVEATQPAEVEAPAAEAYALDPEDDE